MGATALHSTTFHHQNKPGIVKTLNRVNIIKTNRMSMLTFLFLIAITVSGVFTKCCRYDNVNCHDNQFCVERTACAEELECERVCEPDEVWESILQHHHHWHPHHHHHHHCSTWTKVKCAATIARCVAQCSSGVASFSCVSCMGGSYSTCKSCF